MLSFQSYYYILNYILQTILFKILFINLIFFDNCDFIEWGLFKKLNYYFISLNLKHTLYNDIALVEVSWKNIPLSGLFLTVVALRQERVHLNGKHNINYFNAGAEFTNFKFADVP